MRDTCLVCAVHPIVKCLTCGAGLCGKCRDIELLTPERSRTRPGSDHYSQCPSCNTWGGWVDPYSDRFPPYGRHTCECGATLIITTEGEQSCFCNRIFKGEYNAHKG